MSSPTFNLPQSFVRKKARILSQLAVPASEYDDLSPKGSVDDGIRDLIDEINGREEYVTTSSCAGRVSVFLEGQKRNQQTDAQRRGVDGDRGGDGALGESEDGKDCHMTSNGGGGGSEKLAGVGGKGGGGRWLFVSHDPMKIKGIEEKIASFLGMNESCGISAEMGTFAQERLIHFKFEPMILHILTASPNHAQAILGAALQAGFRESGATSLTSTNGEAPTPIVAVRSMGLALESIVGRLPAHGEGFCIVPEGYLEGLIAIANERFEENAQRISRFRSLLSDVLSAAKHSKSRRKGDGDLWENAAVRKERKRAEGLKRSLELRQHSEMARHNKLEDP